MVRFKFFVFALLVLGLGVAHLPLVSGPLSARAVEGALAPATAALSEVARALEARRSTVMELALSLAGNPDVAAAVQPQVEPLPRGKGIRIIEPPVGERFTALRAALGERFGASLQGSAREGLLLGLVTAEGALYARGTSEPTSDAQFDVRALQDAGSAGRVQEAFGASHVFFSVPVLWSPEGGRAQVAATVIVGAPALDPAVIDSAAVTSGVAALALVQGKQILASGGAQKDLASQALDMVGAGQSGQVVQRGGVRSLMAALPGVRLPLFTDPSELFKGQAPLTVGSRLPLGEELEVVAVTSLVPFMTSLADYQQLALFSLMGLLGLSLVWTLLMGAPRPAADAAPAQATGKKKGARADAPAAAPAPVSAPSAGPVFLSPPPEPPSATPDDFPFPASPPPRAAAAAAMAAEPLPAPSAPPVADAFAAPEPAAMTPFVDPPASVAADPYASSPPVAAGAYHQPSAPTGDLYPFSTPDAPRDPFGTPTAPGMDPFATPTVPGKDPFAALGATALPFPSTDPVASVPPASPRRGSNFEFEDHPTAAYSLQQAADPFAAATAQARLQNAGFDSEGDSPEPTRVATIPQELLARSARPMTGEVTVPPSLLQGQHPGVASSMSGPGSPGMGGVKPSAVVSSPFATGGGGGGAVALSEEQHFQEVFREFVQTRDQCGEPQDGLTYDKFVAKLRKNREQLVQKYACKTVRFQVYVKEGKAALKATPVKD